MPCSKKNKLTTLSLFSTYLHSFRMTPSSSPKHAPSFFHFSFAYSLLFLFNFLTLTPPRHLCKFVDVAWFRPASVLGRGTFDCTAERASTIHGSSIRRRTSTYDAGSRKSSKKWRTAMQSTYGRRGSRIASIVHEDVTSIYTSCIVPPSRT
jgi:hypothetical protein